MRISISRRPHFPKLQDWSLTIRRVKCQTGYLLGVGSKLYFSAEMQSGYSTVPADWAIMGERAWGRTSI